MQDCIFCKIVAGEIPADKVYEDEHLIAFHDIKPAAPVHILIVPKKHFADLMDFAQHEANQVLSQAILKALPSIVDQVGLAGKGFRVINNCGAEGGQTVMHLHFHLLGGRILGEKLL